MRDRFITANRLVDSTGCIRYTENILNQLRKRLMQEQSVKIDSGELQH